MFAQAYYQEADDEQGETLRVGESPESLPHCESPSAVDLAAMGTNPVAVPYRLASLPAKHDSERIPDPFSRDAFRNFKLLWLAPPRFLP